MNKRLSVLMLLFLSPLSAEAFSGNTYIVRLLTIDLPFVLGVYGVGALLIREIARRNNLSFVSILLWGAAYGVFEEGILVKALSDPTFSEFFLRAGGVAGIAVLVLVYITT